MNNATMLYVHQKVQQCASQARSAVARVRQARTLREVRDWGTVHPDAIIRGIDHTIPELRQLAHARSDRAQQLVQQQLLELRKLLDEQGLQAFRTRVGQRIQHDWIFLRGEHARIFRYAEQEVALMEYKWRKSQPPESSSAQAQD